MTLRSMMPPATIGDRAMALELATVGVISAMICTASDRLAVMTVVVPAVIGLRCILWLRLPTEERGGSWRGELLFLAGCTALGAFNDWNSVVHHRIYDYGVPVYRPDLSTIPLWMLLYWGMILRSLATLARWRRLGPPGQWRDDVHLGPLRWRHVLARPLVLLALVLLTRQGIYAWYLHPWLSWLPFAAGLGAWWALLRPDRHDLRLLGILALVGPLVEVLYIQVAGLHNYHLGWLGGVPLWIALWWLLAMAVWKEIGGRLQGAIEFALSRWSESDRAPRWGSPASAHARRRSRPAATAARPPLRVAAPRDSTP